MKIEKIIERLHHRAISLHEVVAGKDNSTTRLFVRCDVCYHIWDGSLQSIIYHKTGCPACALKQKIERITNHRKNNTSIDDMLTGRTVARVGEYVNMNTGIMWVCRICNHNWISTPKDIIHSQHGCPRCSKRERVTNEFIDNKIIETKRSIKRLGDSSGCMTKIDWQCTTCTGIWSARPNDVFSTHKSGCPYCQRKNYSRKAIDWLTHIERTHNIVIQHAGNGGEFKIPGTRLYVDGYCVQTNTVYEFHGDAFHGNPKKYEPTDCCHPYDPTLTSKHLYSNTIKREQRIIDAGFKLVIMWESDYDEQLS
jgi:hypothetical protein